MSTNTNSNVNVAGSVGKALLDVPLGDMIMSMGQAIAAAQLALDMNSLRTAQLMTGEFEDAEGNKHSSLVKFDDEKLSLLELGFTPTFYQFVETSIEVKISISMATQQDKSGFTFDFKSDARASAGLTGPFSVGASAQLNISTVGASYSSKFQYSAEGSSTIRTRLVPVPSPALLEERIRRSLDKKYAKRTGQTG